MPFGKLQRPHPPRIDDSFRTAFRAGLLFCLLAPPLLFVFLEFLPGILDRLVTTTPIVGAPSSDMPPLRPPFSIPLSEWLTVLVPGGLCALFWCIAHVGARRIISGWHFVGVAVVLPALLIVVGSPLYALFFDAAFKKELHETAGYLLIGVLNPMMWPWVVAAVIKLIGVSYAWIHTALTPPPGSSFAPAHAGLFAYLCLAGAAWTFAALAEAYATARSTMKSDGAWQAGTHGFLRMLAHPLVVLGRLAGLLDAPERTRGQRVAHATAAPWLVPALCAFVYFTANRIPSLFPLLLVGCAFASYGVVLALWRIGDAITMTDHQLGGALVGFASALVVSALCFGINIQIWAFAVPLGKKAQFAVLASYLPSMLALLVSLVRSTQAGWRAGDIEAEYAALIQRR